MSVIIKTMAFARRPSSLIQSGRFWCSLEAHGSRGLLLILFWQVWSKMENRLGRCVCWFCSCFCFGPFLSSKQSCSKGFMCMFSSLEFDHKFPVAFEKSDLTDREHGGHCRLLMDELGNGEAEVHEKQMPPSARKPPLCLMLSLLKRFWLFGLDTYCKLELSESIFLVSNLVYQKLLAHHILFCITVCGCDSQPHLCFKAILPEAERTRPFPGLYPHLSASWCSRWDFGDGYRQLASLTLLALSVSCPYLLFPELE